MGAQKVKVAKKLSCYTTTNKTMSFPEEIYNGR